MELYIVFLLSTLILHVLADYVLPTMAANRTDEVPFGPKLTSPKLLLHRWHSLEYLTCRYHLDPLDYFHRTVCRNRLHKKMHVVFLNPNLQKFYLVPLRCFQTNFSQ